MLPILQREKEYERLYWQNVWELEEAEIVPKDIQIWRKELLVGGKYTASIVSFLLSHRDRSYFRTLNVDLLFDLLNELAENLPAFDAVTKMLFRKTKKDFQGRETGERAAVLSCDSLTEAFRRNKEDDEFIKRNTDFIKLSIYMAEIDMDRIGSMWADVYVKTPEVVEGYPCSFLTGDKNFGDSVREGSLAEIWKNSRGFNIMRKRLSYPTRQKMPISKCASCADYPLCHGDARCFQSIVANKEKNYV